MDHSSGSEKTTKRIRGILVDTDSAVEVSLVDGAISAIEDIDQAAELPYLAPGFVDIQVNGFGGVDYSGADLSVDGVESVCRELISHGTTQHVATIITRPRERILATVRALQRAVRSSQLVASSVIGIHVEGPFISGEDGPRGAHERDYVRGATVDELEEWMDASGGLLTMVTMAPEAPGAMDLIRRASSRGITVGLGHTGAAPDTIHAAVRAGASVSTHLGNGSASTIERLTNHIWPQLADDELFASVIADGEHLPPDVLKVFWRTKGPDRILLISDVSPLAGLPPGKTNWGGTEVEIGVDGVLRVAGTPYLAGAGRLLDTAVPHLVENSEATLSEAVRACTQQPAKLLGLPPGIGHLEVGRPANLVLFRAYGNGQPLEIADVVVNGTFMAPE
jgi:N-acetylglucosamine-6-phosphate deacetylase